MGQSRLCALGRLSVRDGDGAGGPLASRELGHIPPYLLDLRDRSRWAEYHASAIRAGFGYGSPGDSGGGSFRDLPSRCHPIYSSSTCALIPRPIEQVFPKRPRPSLVQFVIRDPRSDSPQNLLLEESCSLLIRAGWLRLWWPLLLY